MHLRLFLGSAIMAIAAIFVVPHASAQTQSAGAAATGGVLASTDTRIGRLEFERGYPSQATVKTLFDQMDFQRATQALPNGSTSKSRCSGPRTPIWSCTTATATSSAC